MSSNAVPRPVSSKQFRSFPPGKAALVSIDLGKGWSGISFTLSYDCGHIQSGAPGAVNAVRKTPSFVLKIQDGNQNKWLLGQEAMQKYAEYVNIGRDNFVAFRNSKTEVMNIQSFGFAMRMEGLDGRGTDSLLVIVVKTLELLKVYALEKLKIELGRPIQASDCAWVLTIPPLLNTHAQRFLKKAANDAG